MDKTDWLAVLMAGILMSLLIYIGFFFGRKYEEKFWARYYKDEMQKVCMECAGLTHPNNTFTEVP